MTPTQKAAIVKLIGHRTTITQQLIFDVVEILDKEGLKSLKAEVGDKHSEFVPASHGRKKMKEDEKRSEEPDNPEEKADSSKQAPKNKGSKQ